MVKELEENLTGVTCLFCGVHTPLPISMNRRLSAGTGASPRLFIVRCCECGKEAAYLAIEIIALEGKSKTLASTA